VAVGAQRGSVSQAVKAALYVMANGTLLLARFHEKKSLQKGRRDVKF